jgi:DNA/RNA endonuclease YhcR with UshA esterase domain
MKYNNIIYFIFLYFLFTCYCSVSGQVIPIESIDSSKIGASVTVAGRIVNMVPPASPGMPYTLFLSDGKGTIGVLIEQQIYDQLSGRDQIKMNAQIQVAGTVVAYQNSFNIQVKSARDVQIALQDQPVAGSSQPSGAPPVSPPPTLSGILTPGQVNDSHIGQIVNVQGVVQKFEPTWNERQPNTVTLQDALGVTVRVVYWKPVADVLGQERTPKAGQLLRVRGQVNKFREFLQIMINNAADIIDVNAPGTQSADSVPLGSITRDFLNKQVKIQGTVTNIRPSWKETAPDIVTITDGAAEVNVVYWADVKSKIPPQHLPDMGKVMQIEGWVDEYRNAMQVKVDNPYKIISVGGSSTAAAVSSVSAGSTASPAPSTPMAAASGASSASPPFLSTLTPATSEVQGPGFYKIDQAQRIIKGPPTQPHVLLFSSSIPDILARDPQFLRLSTRAVFVWLDIKESSHIAGQLRVSGEPTWIFYDATGMEQGRFTQFLTPSQIEQQLSLIVK